MIFISETVEEFAHEVKQGNYEIVVYGAGVIGKVVVPYLMQEQGLVDRVLCFVDADENKQEKSITVGKKEIIVLNPEYLKKINRRIVILITASRPQAILTYLNGCTYLDDIRGYLLPQMLVGRVL